MLSQAKERDYLFDNYKALLVFLVVVGHFIEPCYKNNDFLFFLKWLIVSFHMPAFIFIKRDSDFENDTEIVSSVFGI